MGEVHFVESTEIFLRPFRPRGYEKGTSHQNNIVRTNHLAGILTQEVGTTIIDRGENEPDDDIEDDESNDDEITDILFHADSSMMTAQSFILKCSRRLKG